MKSGNYRDILDDMSNCIRSLKGTESEEEMNGHEVISACLEKVPTCVYERWLAKIVKQRVFEGTKPTLETLRELMFWYVKESEDVEYGHAWARTHGHRPPKVQQKDTSGGKAGQLRGTAVNTFIVQ